jgi:hypothetical protein
VRNALFRKLNREKALVVDSQKIGEAFRFMFYSANEEELSGVLRWSSEFRRPRKLLEKTVVQDVEPTNNSVQHHPQNRMIDAPRDCNRQHTAEAPETDACRLMILHSSSLLAKNENCFPTRKTEASHPLYR